MSLQKKQQKVIINLVQLTVSLPIHHVYRFLPDTLNETANHIWTVIIQSNVNKRAQVFLFARAFTFSLQ